MSDCDNTHNTADSRLCYAEKDSAAHVSRGGKTVQYYREYLARKKAEREKEELEMIAGGQSRKRKTAAEYQREYRACKKKKKSEGTFSDPELMRQANVVFSTILTKWGSVT